RGVHRSVLDVPCGRGRLLRAMARHRPDLRLTAADLNLEMTRQAQATVPPASIVRASVYALPVVDRAFDIVMCHQSFMHFDRPALALAELTRLARLDVYLSVTTSRQLNTLLRRLGLLGSDSVPHWTHNIEDLTPMLPRGFDWRITGAFLLGAKTLRLSHARYSA